MDNPVFVDPSGRRLGLLQIAGRVAGGCFAAYLVLVGVSLVAPPGLDRLQVPGVGDVLPGQRAPEVATTDGTQVGASDAVEQARRAGAAPVPGGATGGGSTGTGPTGGGTTPPPARPTPTPSKGKPSAPPGQPSSAPSARPTHTPKANPRATTKPGSTSSPGTKPGNGRRSAVPAAPGGATP